MKAKEAMTIMGGVLGILLGVTILQSVHILRLKAQLEESAKYKTRCVEMHAEMKEYWRVRCGCFTVEEVMDAFTRPAPGR